MLLFVLQDEAEEVVPVAKAKRKGSNSKGKDAVGAFAALGIASDGDDAAELQVIRLRFHLHVRK